MKSEDIKTAMLMRATGFSQREIAEELEVSQATISNCMKKIKREASYMGVSATVKKYMEV